MFHRMSPQAKQSKGGCNSFATIELAGRHLSVSGVKKHRMSGAEREDIPPEILQQPVNRPFHCFAFFAADDAPFFLLQAQDFPVG